MFGSTTPMPTDPNDRIARVEAKIDGLAKQPQWLLVLVVIVLVISLTSIFI